MIHTASTRNTTLGRLCLPLAAAVCLLAGTRAFAVQTNLYYVNSANGANASPPFLSWATAATNVQEAVDLAEAAVDIANGVFCEVVVTDGVHVVSAAVTLTAPIRLRSLSGDPATTALSGSYPAAQHRVLHLTGEAWVSGFTISNGYAYGGSPTNYGGGVFMTTNGFGKAGLLSDCRVANNQARKTPTSGYAYGCGIYLDRGGTVSNCIIQANKSDLGRGGGVFFNYGGQVMGCTITNNNCSTAAVTEGGGVFLNYGGFVTNCFFARNVARTGRGMGVTFNSGGVVVGCTFTDHNGPAIRFLSTGGRVSHCIITNNLTGVSYEQNGTLEYSLIHSNNGAGIVAARDSQIYNCIVSCNNGRGLTGDSRMIVRNTLVYGNVTDADGGGVRGATLENVTIVRNQAAQGGGVSSIGINSKNLIVYDNLATVESNNYYNVGVITYSCTTPLIPGVGNTDKDPRFRKTGSGHGATAVAGDWRLLPSSPCRDTGLFQTWMNTAFDIRGYPRILPTVNGVVDRGAYENIPVPGATLLYIR